jgi:o-succinylbenzoate synthase
MLIDELAIREIRMRLKAPFETSFGATWERRVLLVEAHSDGATGWAEITAGEGPFYNPETTDTSWTIFRDFVAPRIVGNEIGAASDVPVLLGPIRGHNMTKGAVENALWDLEAQQKGLPLPTLLGGAQQEISSGVSLGIRANVADLIAAIEKELAAGYQRIKVKIKPGRDLEVIQAVRREFRDINLMVDGNAAYKLEDTNLLKRFDEYDLMMIEQPLAWDEIYQNARLQAMLATPICLDECIHNLRHAQAAIELGACRILNIKLGRVGGHTEARRIQEFCREKGTPAWCGGMLESGVGRAHNIAMASLPGFVLPGDVSASRRYWNEDIIDPEIEVTPRGTIPVPKAPGLGYRIRQDLVEKLTVRKEIVRAADRNRVARPV